MTKEPNSGSIESDVSTGASEGANGVAKIQDLMNDEETLLSIRESTTGYFEEICREVFRQKREYLVHRIAGRLSSGEHSLSTEGGERSDAGDWIGIESLSRLRSVVGGRFQNLKKRWVKAGLPLKEHRGDQNLDYTLNEEGWVELTNWILKQGYEARLTDNQTGYLFELRQLGD